jgi:hypothetical protein
MDGSDSGERTVIDPFEGSQRSRIQKANAWRKVTKNWETSQSFVRSLSMWQALRSWTPSSHGQMVSPVTRPHSSGDWWWNKSRSDQSHSSGGCIQTIFCEILVLYRDGLVDSERTVFAICVTNNRVFRRKVRLCNSSWCVLVIVRCYENLISIRLRRIDFTVWKWTFESTIVRCQLRSRIILVVRVTQSTFIGHIIHHHAIPATIS